MSYTKPLHNIHLNSKWGLASDNNVSHMYLFLYLINLSHGCFIIVVGWCVHAYVCVCGGGGGGGGDEWVGAGLFLATLYL